ncbi:hypothetical protein ONZ51_g2140 [Trametes cubensis]|uniref:Telomerase reverse transcriptase n=1 Tax=Trametes cubensis TaxID=1111947 RepID=A0AAD7U2J3_9APHY|nr:hypothetical protein ONZ51_g2140 [Trametes cubensis]
MFYSRPSLAPHTSRIVFGLPTKHVLNRFYPSWAPKPKAGDGEWVDPDPRQQMEHARHLAKYVFPRQYSLKNPFDSPGSHRSSLGMPPDYLDREQEIKLKGSCKTPKRLKAVLDSLDKMIWRHHKCRYKALLDLSCPSKVTYRATAGRRHVDKFVQLRRNNATPLDNSVILELMSEMSIQLQTQASVTNHSISLDLSGRPIFVHDQSQARRQLKHKPRFAEFVCGVDEVFRYAVLVTRAVIPKVFWGSKRNFLVTMGYVKHMITTRRYETLSLHQVLQNFQTTDCDWLIPPGEGMQHQARVSLSDSLKRRELLEEFLFWYFDSFIIPLMKTTFYVTESSAFRNKVLYFRHDDWSTLCAPLVEKLSTDTFQQIDQHEAQEILRQRQLGFSFVRLLPKETGDAHRPGQSINQILQASFQILTYEKNRQLERIGASAFGPNEIYAKLKTFKDRLTGGNPSAALPKLYFVKVDVQACFDTIEQTKLLEILRELLLEDAYMIQRYGTVHKAGEKIQRKFVKKAHPEDDHPHFLTYAAQLAQGLRHTLFADQVVYPFSRRKEIIALLEEHITENIVKIGDEYYRQVVGIPQGSVLSALLCSFFYGHLEREKFAVMNDPECVLMRLIDDWLLITTNHTKAVDFYDMLSAGHPEYGCFISKDKSLVNFEHPELVNIVDPRSRVFPWCGYSINMRDLSVTVDYARYHATYLQDSLTVEYGRRPGAAFAFKMMQLAKSKSHIIYNDASLNSSDAVHLNIYQNFTVLAMKMHYYLKEWRLDMAKHHMFVLNTIRRTIRFAYTSACNKATHKLARAHHARVNLQERQVTWLGLHAFHSVLSRKPQAYARLLKMLSFQLSLPRYRHLRKRFRGVVAEGLSTVTLLCF